ncbi:MAG TPA: hypothetical protein VNK04_22325 [Gemmataceae bacterium]|nr:hypothetical protein [Gemmataceae bacterium]
MQVVSLITVSLSALAVALTGPPDAGRAGADELTLPDGSRRLGRLEMDGKGRLRFAAPGQPVPASLADLDIRLAPGQLAPWHAAMTHRVTLRGEQHLTGELLELNEKELKLRTPWADRLSVPRRAVVALAHPPGWVTFVNEDFENDLTAWKLTGTPALSDRQQTSGRRSLRIDTPGQAAEYTLTGPLAAGRAGVNFFDPGSTSGVRWLIEAEFARPQGPWTARFIAAADAEHYRFEAPRTAGQAAPVPRTRGWHRLTLRFDRDYLFVGVDERLLWASDKEGPGGPLHKLRLVCVAGPGGSDKQGEGFFDDLSLTRAVDDLPHRAADVTQDEAWLLAGDQLLGRVVRADRHAVELEGWVGRQTFTWGEVRGLFLRRENPPPQTTEGEHVRVWLHAAAGGEPDQLEGVLQSLDDRRLVLRHAVLGEVEIERGRLLRLRGLFHGRRVELDNNFHHLGDPRRVVPELQPARAEGPTLRRTFRLDTVPTGVRLEVQVVHLKGPGDGIGAALERGELRTEVVVNGQRVDYLNRHVGRASEGPRRIRVILPRRSLRAGDNVLELRQVPDSDGRRESCGIAGLALELPR